LALVSKVGARRTPDGGIVAWDAPAELRLGIEENLRSLGTDRLAAVNLRLMDGTCPRAGSTTSSRRWSARATTV